MFGSLIRRRARATEAAVDPQASLSHSTSFSLTTEVPRPMEGALAAADAADLPVARIVADRGQALARIRAITAGGMVADVTAEVTVGTGIHVELASDQRIAGTIVWVRSGCVGIRFDDHADMRDLLPRNRVNHGLRARPPRLEIRCGASVRIGKIYHRAEVRDLSQAGVKLALRDPDCIGRKAIVTVESLRPIAGTVRWYKGSQAGILFDRALAFEELAEWMSKRVEFACLKAGAWNR